MVYVILFFYLHSISAILRHINRRDLIKYILRKIKIHDFVAFTIVLQVNSWWRVLYVLFRFTHGNSMMLFFHRLVSSWYL